MPKKPHQKIRYRLVFNHSRRLNRRGEGLVQVECQQGRRRCYFSTGVYLEPQHWQDGQVAGHELSTQLNVILRRRRIDIERIELDYMLRDVRVSLQTLRDAVKESTAPSAQLTDFGRQVIAASDRRDVTKANYRTLFNDLDRFARGVRVDEVDYAFIARYEQHLRDHGVCNNTLVGRLRLLRAVMNEAVRRDIIDRNPFDRYHVSGMTARKGFLSEQQLAAVEGLKLSGRQQVVRDCFLFCCYTGLRFSDLRALRSEHIQRGWLRIRMQKTSHDVSIPLQELFDGKADIMLRTYGSPEQLTARLPHNSQVNQTLRDLMAQAHIPATQRVTFHTSRHTFASILLERGVPVTTVQRMLGHTKLTTTQIYAEVTDQTITRDMRRLSRKKHNQCAGRSPRPEKKKSLTL